MHLHNKIVLRKSIPDFEDKVAYNVRMTIEKVDFDGLRITLDPELIVEQSDPEAIRCIEDYNVISDKFTGSALVNYLKQVALSHLALLRT